MSYNGWTNRETWCVNLHLDDAFRSIAEEYVEDYATWNDETNTFGLELRHVARFEPLLEEMFFDTINLGTREQNLLAYDLINIVEIDFRQIAEHHLTDCLRDATENQLKKVADAVKRLELIEKGDHNE